MFLWIKATSLTQPPHERQARQLSVTERYALLPALLVA
jgi:hypothetical protein